MGTGHHAAVAAKVGPGKTAAVVGDGAVGLCGVLAARRLGAEQIILLGRHPDRIALAKEFGATDVVVSREPDGRDAIEHVAQVTGGVMADLVVEAVGHEEQQFNLACGLARAKGRVLYFGIPPERQNDVAFEAVVRKSLTIHTSVPDDLRPFVMIAQRMIKRERIDPVRLVPILHYDGTPITARFIARAISDHLDALKVTPLRKVVS